MAERRLKQWIVPGSLWDDALQDGQTGLSACIELLKAHCLVPYDAVPTHCFTHESYDYSILRFRHTSFELVNDFAPIPTEVVSHRDVGLEGITLVGDSLNG